MSFLDDTTADFSQPGLHELHEILIRAYDAEYEALALAGQVGLLRADIAIQPKLRYTWQSILEEAAKEGQLRRLVDQALQDQEIAAYHAQIRTAIAIPSGPVAPRAARGTGARTIAESQTPEVGDRASLWAPGSTLSIRFLDGTPKVRSMVETVASEWLEYANLHFDWSDDPDAPLRVSFEREGSWAYQGRDCLAAPPDEPTINFGWLNDSTPMSEVKRVVLHEFGHVLGMQHEHGNPASTLRWNRPVVYESFTGPPNYWTRETIDKTIFAIWPPSYFPVHKVFDPESIMIFALPAEYFEEGGFVGLNLALSPVDKQFAAALYPVREGR